MKSKLLCILFVFLLYSVCFAKYSGGTGEPNNPYRIATPNDLNDISNHTEDYNDCFILVNDINMAEYNYTTAVIAPDTSSSSYFQGTVFTGVFDGNDHTILSLIINDNDAGNDYLGLFGVLGEGSLVKNLKIEDVNIIGDGSYLLGGLCGCNGERDNPGGSIINCHATGFVTGGTFSHHFGGLCGSNSYGSIINCYAAGSVTGGDNSAALGGLCGENHEGTINNCYSTGSVTGGDNSAALGGLCGHNIGGTISNCYAAGSINGIALLGGLCGYNEFGSISDCYFLDIAGPDNELGTPLTDIQMKLESSFVGWDFVDESANGTSYFWIIEPDSYPTLFFFDDDFVPCDFEGEGTQINPYRIYDANALGAIWQKTNSHYILENDINLAGINWSVAVIPSFNSSFNGAGHIISNLVITGGSYLGLFGQLSGNSYILNLGLEDVNIAGGDYSRYLGGLCGENFGTISDCYATGFINGGWDSCLLGGLCGGNRESTIGNCYAAGTVTGGDDSWLLGGLCGWNYGGNISNCYSTSSVNGNDYLGGLCGRNQEGTISDCFSRGPVTGGGDYSNDLGGLCGHNYKGSIGNCYATGSVNGDDNSRYLGGLCGRNYKGFISNCYVTGSVNGGDGSHSLGGLCGYNNDTISGCYFLDTAGLDNGYGTPLTDEQMKLESSFVGWDFNTPIWEICTETVDYPHLWWEYYCNSTPIANAGPNQTAYADLDGWAEVVLDGNDSYDPDGDPLTYLWSWIVDSNTYEANSVSPTIDLPVGEHQIELIVNDGIEDSEPNYVVVEVIDPVEARLWIFPQAINRHSRMEKIIAWLRLPEGITKDQIDSSEPLVLYPEDEPNGIEATKQFVIQRGRGGSRRTSIIAYFDKSELIDAVPDNGRVELEVVGNLTSGQYLYGTDTIRIKDHRWR